MSKSGAKGESHSGRGAASEPTRPDWVLRDVVFRDRAWRDRSDRRTHRRRQDHDHFSAAALLRRAEGRDPHRRRRHSKKWICTDLRRRFGVVLQDPFLFTGTVGGNIRLGTDWIEDDDVEQAAEEVNLADFIRTLPAGFNEEVRERGSTLSTGQKQLISFRARPGAQSEDPHS